MKQVSNKLSRLKLIFFSFLGLFMANTASAQVCPVCVVAVGAGLGFSRFFGIDDVVASIWIGAFLTIITIWTLMWMKKKNWSFQDDGVVITLAYILLTYIPLYYAGIVGNPLNMIFGMDKIIFGSTVGTIAFFIGHWINLYLKKKNNGMARFPYQKVVIPVGTILITSLVFHILLQNNII